MYSKNKVAISKLDETSVIKGRRDYLHYRDLGVTQASKGTMRVEITTAKSAAPVTTGWRKHLCEGEFVYMLRGWMKIAFADSRVERVATGDSIYIPGDTPHNATTSEDCEFLEISVPAEMGTVSCKEPR